MALFDIFKKKKKEEESTAPSSSQRVQDAVQNLYQKATANQQAAVQADLDVARVSNQRVQNAAKDIYSAYARQQEEAAREKERQDRERIARQRELEAQRQEQEAARLEQERAAREEQRKRLAEATQNIYSAVKNKTQNLYSQAQEKSRQASERMAQNTPRLYGTAREFLERQDDNSGTVANMLQQQEQARQAGQAAAAAFNAIPGQMAKGFLNSDEDAMRAQLQREGYSDSAIDAALEAGLLNPTARYDRIQDDTWYGQAAANYNMGELQQEADVLLGQGIIRGDQEMIDRGMQLRQQAAQYQENNQTALEHDSGTVGNMLWKDMAQYLPQATYQQMAALPTQPLALMGKYGEAAAQALGAGSLSYTTMAGAAYADMLEQGVDPQAAARMAKDEAAISSVIEFGDTFFDWAFGVGAGLNPFKGTTEKAAKSLGNGFVKGLMKWAGNTGQEYAEEFTQELVSMANERRAADGNTDGGVWQLLSYVVDEAKTQAPDLYKAIKENMVTQDAQRLMEAGRGGAVIGGIAGGLGQAYKGIQNIKTEVQRSQVNKAFDAIVADPETEALNEMADEQLTVAAETANAMGRTDAMQVLRDALARRMGEQQEQQIAPERQATLDQAVRDIQAAAQQTEPQEEAAPEIAPERQAAVEQAAQDIREQMGEQAAEEEGVPAPFTPYTAPTQQTNENAPTERGAVEVDLEGAFDNGEQGTDRGQQNGYDALGTGGEDLRNEAGTQREGVDTGYESGQGRDRFQNYGVKETVTPAALGVTNGSTTQNVEVLDETTFEPGSPEAQAAQAARDAGLEPVFIRGTMDVNGKRARAYIKNGRVILQADGKVSADKLLRHEQYHEAARNNAALRQSLRQELKRNMSAPELTNLITRYIQAYDGVYDFSRVTMDEIVEICEEELFADLYAGIDNSGRQELRDAARQGYTQAQVTAQDTEAQQDTTGPPAERFSLRDKVIPTRDELEAKDPIPVVDIRGKADGPRNKQRTAFRQSEDYRSLISEPVMNRDTEEPLFVTGNSISHSFRNEGQDQIFMVQHLREILENAVLTHGEPSRTADNDHTTGVYKLFGAVMTDDGIQPVKITAKEFRLDGQSVPENVRRYLDSHPDSDTYGIVYDGKVLVIEGIEKEASGSVRAASNNRSDTDTYPSASTISIMELLDLVKGEDRKYIPQRNTAENEGRASSEVRTKTAEEYNADRQRALDYFGTTYNANEAGYITTDGRYLDFSGKKDGAPGGSRTLDHRDVGDAFDGEYGDGSYSGAMVEFMRGGNIRVSPESGGIDLIGKPTKRQADKLQQFIQKYRGEVVLDIDDQNGNTLFSLEYPRMTNSFTILQDINDYFDKGIKPQVYDNGRFSVETEEADRIEANLADELTAPKKGIDINPDETEAAVSSTIGLTEEDNAALGGGDNMLSSLFGPTAEETEAQQAAAADKAGKAANDALNKYVQDLPEDPMDLYQKQQKVTPATKGEEKITTKKRTKDSTLKEKVSAGWHGLIRTMVNDEDAIHQVGLQTGNTALDGMYFYAKAANQRAQDWIQKKRMSFGLDRTGDSLNSIFDPIRQKGDDYYKNFQLYMYHMLNVERMSRDNGDTVVGLKDTLKQLRQQAHKHRLDLGSMTDDELQRRAQAYREGGVGGLYDETGDLVSQYWEAKKELMRAEKAQNKPVFGWDEGAPDAEASKKIAEDLRAAHPEFEQEAQKVYDYIDDLLQYRVDAGLITEEDKNNLQSIYPHYVPVLYDFEEAPKEIRKGGLTVSTGVKSAKGGNTTLLPLHYALARQTLGVMRNTGANQLGTAILSEYENNEELMSKWVQKMVESDQAWDPAMADNDDVQMPNENVLSVLRNGKRYDLTLSPDMAYAFNSLRPSGDNNALQKFMGGANDLFKKLCTAYNPLFMISNPVRDVQDALFYSTDTKNWIKNYPKAWSQIASNGKYWQMYNAMGGVYNTYFDWAKGENKKEGSKIAQKIEQANLWIEQAPRLAEFMTTLQNAEKDHGEVTQADLMEAFNNAAEVTTNFSRSGRLGRGINRYVVPFWNPGVQGLSKAVRTATETKGFKSWALLTAKAVALGMAPVILNGLLYRDDDEWDKIRDTDKANYYLFKGKDGVWIKIPRGRVLAMLGTPAVAAQEALRGDEVKLGEMGNNMVEAIAPNNPLTTNLFSPVVESRLWDKASPGKTWYGGDIESKRLQGYAPGERYDESTDAISKWLGGKLNLSPKKLSYIMDQYSGVIGDIVMPYLTPKAERGIYVGDVALPLSNAFMSRFTLDTVTNNTISTEYYDLLDELGWAANSGDDAAAMAKKYMNRAGSKVSELYGEIRQIENDKNLTDKEKTQLTRELRKQLNQYQMDATEDAKAYLETAQKYMEEHPEADYSDENAVDAYVQGYNSQQTDEKDMITADDAEKKMQDVVYRETNREQFGAEYALQAYNADTYAKAQELNEESGLSYDDYYDYYFGTKNIKADKDANGKSISGSKKEKIVAYIDGMDIPDEQKDALYLANNYSANNLEETPWHSGHGQYAETPAAESAAPAQQTEEPEHKTTGNALESLFTGKTPAKQAPANKTTAKPTGETLTASGTMNAADKKRAVYDQVQEKKAKDPNYDPAADGKGWTVWADRAVESGISIDDAITHMNALSSYTADYDQYGKAITGSKKQKVVDYIQSQKGLTDAQKDLLYLYVYNENSLRYTPWHGYTGESKSTRKRRGGRRGGGRRKISAKATKPVAVGQLAKGYDTGVDISSLFGGGALGSRGGSTKTVTASARAKASAADDLLEIVDKYYGGNFLEAALAAGQKAKTKGRTKVDFKI